MARNFAVSGSPLRFHCIFLGASFGIPYLLAALCRSGSDTRRILLGQHAWAAPANPGQGIRDRAATLKTLALFAAVFAALYAALCLLVFATQRKQIYYPTAESYAAGATALRLPVDGAELKIWSVDRGGADALVYFGGNAEDVGANVAMLKNLLPGYSLFLVNYRGYGGSSGSATEKTLYADALQVVDYVAARHPNIAVMGRSLGSGVGSFVAVNRPLGKVILVTPFDSLADVAAGFFPYLPVSLLLTERFDSVARVSRISAPTLVIVAENDEIIARHHSDRLIAGFTGRQPIVAVIPGAGHNDLQENPAYAATLREFLH